MKAYLKTVGLHATLAVTSLTLSSGAAFAAGRLGASQAGAVLVMLASFLVLFVCATALSATRLAAVPVTVFPTKKGEHERWLEELEWRRPKADPTTPPKKPRDRKVRGS